MITQKFINLFLLSQPDFCTRLVLSVCAHPSRHLHELHVDHGPEDDAGQVQDPGDGHLQDLAQPLLRRHRRVSRQECKSFPMSKLSVHCICLFLQSTPSRDVPEQHYQLTPQVATNHPHIVPGCLSTESQGRVFGFTKLAI